MAPILYTFRRCPYAIRARMGLAYAGVDYEVREVILRDKPASMLALSPKGTVPVLQLGEQVLDESVDILYWALARHDPDGWLDWDQDALAAMNELIDACELTFKPSLDGYKYADTPAQSLACRAQAQAFLQRLENSFTGAYLFGERLSLADICLFPFVRQFAHVDKAWFDAQAYPKLQVWLEGLLASALFLSIMTKYPLWQEADPVTIHATKTAAATTANP